MKKLIQSNPANCVGCNRCVRECPIETANLTYQDKQGNIKVDVDKTQCIACGKCISVCKHHARYYVDDLKRFFSDLAKGVPISLITAPALKSNFPNWRNIISWLRQQGVRKIYDVSFGADICTWAHLRYIESNKPKSLLTQPCPAIVSYCEIHRHDLLPRLSPIHSPMACTAIYMTKYEGITDTIAALSPCIAKGHEFESTGMADYNITFAKLQEYINANNITLPDEEGDFDHSESGWGTIFPMPGGLKEIIKFFIGPSVRIDKSEGNEVYRMLDEYAQTPKHMWPDVFDVLSCAEGCNIGPGGIQTINRFQLHQAMDDSRKTAASRDKSYYEDIHRQYDATLKLSDFLREYKPKSDHSYHVFEEDIQDAFRQMDKDSFEKQNLNCGACGSNTCRDMARKIALKTNIPINCIYWSRDDAQKEHRKNAQYIDLVQQLGENLISFMEDEHSDAVINSLQDICLTFNSSLSSLWKVDRVDGAYQSSRLFYYAVNNEAEPFKIRGEVPGEWLEQLAAGKHLVMNTSETKPDLFLHRDQLIVAVPITVKAQFWGFITLVAAPSQNYKDEDISAIAASGMLIASSIYGRQLEQNVYIDALTGIHNRRYFMEFSPKQFDMLKREKKSGGLMILDLDFFKQVNDTYGHDIGDKVLRMTAESIKENLRSYDLFARYGGEEFIIFLSDLDEKIVVESAERIRNHVAQVSRQSKESPTPITLSIGLALNTDAPSLEKLIQHADKALYAAKKNGRNQTCLCRNEQFSFYGNPKKES